MSRRGITTLSLILLTALVAGCRPTVMMVPAPDVTVTTWSRTYGGSGDDVASDLLLADDGGYFIVGTTNLEWEPEMRGDVYLIRTDANGEVLWERTYGGPAYDAGYSIIETSDGGLAIGGVSTSFGAGDMDAYLIKLDQDGNELWSNTYGGPLDEMGGVQQTADGGFVLGGNIVDPNDVVVDDPGVAGYGGFAGRSSLYVVRTDAEGNELWSRTFDDGTNAIGTTGLQTSDGSFLSLATISYFPDSDEDISLLKIDADGNLVWSRSWEEGRSGARDLIETSDGNYLIAGEVAPIEDTDNSEGDFLFIKVDPEGNELWRSAFGEPGVIDTASLVAQTTDGGYVAAGDRSADLRSWDDDISLIKIDQDGQLVWQRVIQTNTHQMYAALLQHPDGGYVIAASIFGGQAFDIFLIKTDAEGRMGG